MLTVLEALKLSSEYLQKKGIESPRLNAELLLSEILGLKRLELYLQFERPITESEKEKYREYLARRAKREPLQYILGYAEFMGEKFVVTKDVLIPRPETELLVEKITNENMFFSGSVLEVGTGSGNIAIMLKKLMPEAKITTLDISAAATDVAKKNAEVILKEKNDIVFLTGDFLSHNFSGGKFDILVSNPPYISLDDYENLEPELKDHEPRIALTDGKTGELFYEVLVNRANELLVNNGSIYLELGYDKKTFVTELLQKNGFGEIETTKDYAGIDRIIKAKKVRD